MISQSRRIGAGVARSSAITLVIAKALPPPPTTQLPRDDLPGFTAVGATYDEVRELAHSGAEFYLERPVEVEDRPPRFHRGAGGSA